MKLIAISTQSHDDSRASAAKGDLGFTVASDPGNVFAGKLGVVIAPSEPAQRAHTALGFAVKDSNADDTAAIPFPIVLIINCARSLRFADVQVDYRTRTETEEIVATVDSI